MSTSLADRIRTLPPLEKFDAIAQAIDAGASGPRTLSEETDLVNLREWAKQFEVSEEGLADKIERTLGRKVVIKPGPNGPNSPRMIRRVHWKEYLEALEDHE